MTREEKEKLIQHLRYNMEIGADYLITDEDAVEIIKALEQEPVIDKIRAEIEEQVLESLSDGGDDWFAAEKVNECLEIIDKYKAESEVEE